METKTIKLTDEEVIIKRYRVRTTGKRGASIETTIPREVFERECRRLGLTIEEGLAQLEAVWRYNNFRGLHLGFEKKETPKP